MSYFIKRFKTSLLLHCGKLTRQNEKVGNCSGGSNGSGTVVVADAAAMVVQPVKVCVYIYIYIYICVCMSLLAMLTVRCTSADCGLAEVVGGLLGLGGFWLPSHPTAAATTTNRARCQSPLEGCALRGTVGRVEGEGWEEEAEL